MFRLSFSLPEPQSPWLRTWESAEGKDLADISETDLRYKYFAVGLELVVDDVDVVRPGRFVTLVDLALSLFVVAERISSGEDAAFGFTESDEIINLRQDGDQVEVSSSTSAQHGSAIRQEVVAGIRQFLDVAHSRLLAEYPGLSDNPIIGRIIPA